jgi:hypothetical protein
MYKKHPERYWVQRLVEIRVPIQNARYKLPVGYRMRITSKYAGFDLEACDTCPTCGVGTRSLITRVEPTCLFLIDKEEVDDG